MKTLTIGFLLVFSSVSIASTAQIERTEDRDVVQVIPYHQNGRKCGEIRNFIRTFEDKARQVVCYQTFVAYDLQKCEGVNVAVANTSGPSISCTKI